jgi:hypothetical protein
VISSNAAPVIDSTDAVLVPGRAKVGVFKIWSRAEQSSPLTAAEGELAAQPKRGLTTSHFEKFGNKAGNPLPVFRIQELIFFCDYCFGR